MTQSNRHLSPQSRQAEISSRLEAGIELHTTQLAEEFGVSLDTIRRDMAALEEQGVAERVHGGIAPVLHTAAPFRDRSGDLRDDKRKIASAIAPMIPVNAAVIIDGGWTALSVVHQLTKNFQGTIITPSPAAASAAHDRAFNCVLVGGHMSALSAMAIGSEAERAISNCRAQCSIVTPCSIDPTKGLWADEFQEASMKNAMAEAGDKLIIACTKDKVGAPAHHHICKPPVGSAFVTDAAPTVTSRFAALKMDMHHV